MASRSFSVGNYTRSVQKESDPFDVRLRATLDGTLDTLEDNFENWPAEKVKEAYQGFERANTKHIVVNQNASTFLAVHPEFIDNDANAQLVNRTLKTMFGDCVHTVEQFESTYQVLRVSNSLALDKVKLAEQEKAAAKQRVEAAKSVTPTEEEMYNMPLEELRRLDAIENQKRMQKRGEEGGW